MHYRLILKLRNKSILAISIKSIQLPELVQNCSVLFLFQINFVNLKFLLNLTMVVN